MTQPLFDQPEQEPQPQPRRSQRQEEQSFVDQMMYLLTAPNIGYGDWLDVFQYQKDEITLQRFLHHQEIFQQELCTELEAMLYVSTASLAHPLSHDWVEIYLWLFHRWSPEKAQAAELGEPPKLNRNQEEDLARLRRWIYRNQVDHIKAKSKEAKEVQAETKSLEIHRPRLFE